MKLFDSTFINPARHKNFIPFFLISNKEFLSKAPAEVIEIQRERKTTAFEKKVKLEEALERLSSIIK